VIDDDEPGIALFDLGFDFLDLAAAEERCRSGLRHGHDNAAGDVEIDRLGKANGFLKSIGICA
jgi:hypothetical protein